MWSWSRAWLEARRAAPFGVVLAVALGGAVVLGAHLSNAFPSEARPFGWPGAANFQPAVAMKRSDVVLATTLPAVALGATLAFAPVAVVVDLVVLALACVLATMVGAVGASETRFGAYVAFAVAHALLAWAFFSLGALVGALARRFALPVAFGAWAWFYVAHEDLVKLALFRKVGYHALAAGEFPSWFFAAQAASPLSAYRGVLILWDAKFRDFLERATLEGAQLPGWLNPGSLALVLVVVWVALPLGVAWAASARRSRLEAPVPAPEGA